MKYFYKLLSILVCVSMCLSFFVFSVAADGDDENIILIDYRIRQYSNDPNTYITARVPLQEMQVFGQGQAFGIDELRLDVGYLTKGHIYLVLNFACVDFTSNYVTTGATKITIDSGFQFGNFTNFTNTDGYTVSMWLYNSPNKYFDIPADLKYLSSVQSYMENYPASANSLSMLISIEVPADHGQVLTISFTNPLIIKSNSYYPNDCYWYCSNFQYEYNWAAALYNIISNYSDDLDSIDYSISEIYAWLIDHSDEIENLNDIPGILACLTLMTNNRTWRYRYLSSNYQQIIQSGTVAWYDALFHNVESITSRYLLLGQKNFNHWMYTENSDGSITRSEQTSSWYTALLTSVKNLDFLVRDADRSIQYQSQVDEASSDQQGNEALGVILDDIADANSIGSITGFGGIFQIAPNNPELLTSQGVQGFAFWFTQENYDDLQQNEIHGRGPQYLDGWVLPYNDKIVNMISDLEGGEDADGSD